MEETPSGASLRFYSPGMCDGVVHDGVSMLVDV